MANMGLSVLPELSHLSFKTTIGGAVISHMEQMKAQRHAVVRCRPQDCTAPKLSQDLSSGSWITEAIHLTITYLTQVLYNIFVRNCQNALKVRSQPQTCLF